MAGDRIPISKLKNDHLANIIRYLRKQYWITGHENTYDFISREATLRLARPIYIDLLKEQKRRGKVSSTEISFILNKIKHG
jgi:hypothetical protein